MSATAAPAPGTLAEILPRVPARLFAVVDGAFYDDLPKMLKGADLLSRPLYLDAGSVDGVLFGPHLVDLPDVAAITRFLACLGSAPPAVFWSWPGAQEELYGHLRKLAKVEIPLDREEGGTEVVLFRHADPSVMAAVLAVLDLAQYARLFGTAAGLVMFSADDGGLKVAPRPSGQPRSIPAGFLRIHPHQMEALGQSRLVRSRMTVLRYLRDVSPEETAAFDDKALYGRVCDFEASGNELGLRSEAAHAQWAFLMLTTGGEIGKGHAVRDALQRSKEPDKALNHIVEEMARLHAAAGNGARILESSTQW